MNPQLQPYASTTICILKSFVAQAFSPIKITKGFFLYVSGLSSNNHAHQTFLLKLLMLFGYKLWTNDAGAEVKRERSATVKLRLYNGMAELIIISSNST